MKPAKFDTCSTALSLSVPEHDLPYGVLSYDIETSGLHPHESHVTEVSFSDRATTYVFAIDEDPGTDRNLLQSAFSWLDRYLSLFPETRLASWNGWGFDGPFIQTRVNHLSAAGFSVPVWEQHAQMVNRDDTKPKYPVAGGYEHPQMLMWRDRWEDFDIEKFFIELAHKNGISHGLKPVSKFHGYKPIELDRTRMSSYSAEERGLYACSDTIMTLALAGKVLAPFESRVAETDR